MMLSELIEAEICEAITKYKSHAVLTSATLDLLSMGELIDRLSIVNYKLYDLKNEVMKKQGEVDSQRFLANAAVTDVKLVEERSRLKRAIDEKMISMITKPVAPNAEVKSYGPKWAAESDEVISLMDSVND